MLYLVQCQCHVIRRPCDLAVVGQGGTDTILDIPINTSSIL